VGVGVPTGIPKLDQTPGGPAAGEPAKIPAGSGPPCEAREQLLAVEQLLFQLSYS
jgi:hypothetical protein